MGPEEQSMVNMGALAAVIVAMNLRNDLDNEDNENDGDDEMKENTEVTPQ